MAMVRAHFIVKTHNFFFLSRRNTPKGIRGTLRAALPRDIYHLDRIVAVSSILYTFSEAHRPSNFSKHIRFFFCSPERKLRITVNIKFKFLGMVTVVYHNYYFRWTIVDSTLLNILLCCYRHAFTWTKKAKHAIL